MKKFSPVSIGAGFLLGMSATAIAAGVGGSAIFKDIQSGAYYDSAVGDMYRAGIIKGYDDGRFGPDDFVTRGQVAVMMQRLRADLLGETLVSSSSRSSSSRSSSSSSSSSSSNGGTGPGVFTFAQDEFVVSEDGGTVKIDVIRSSGSKGSVAVRYTLKAGSAEEGDDYDLTTGSLQFSDGETSKSFTIRINDDSKSEGAETISLHLSEPSGGATVGKSTGTVKIDDDESPSGNSSSSNSSTATSTEAGTLIFSAYKYEVLENGNTATITVNRTDGSKGSVSVNYTITNGNATQDHYSSVNGSLSFSAGETSKTFTVTIFDNANIGGNKTVNMALNNPTGGAGVGTPGTAVLTIIDNEISTPGAGSFKFSSDEFEVGENEGYAYITIDRVGGSATSASVSYSTVSGTAIAADFTSTSGTLTFTPGEARKFFKVEIKKDELNDPGETVNLYLSSPTDGTELNTPSSATMTIY